MRKMSLGEEDKVDDKIDDEIDEGSSSSFGDSLHFDRQLSFSFHRSQLGSLTENTLIMDETDLNDQTPVLPSDIVVHQIGSFVNDPKTLYSMACVSRAWRLGLRNNLLSSPVIWHRLYLYRWMRSLSAESSHRQLSQHGPAHDESDTDWKQLYRQRHGRDKAVLHLVREVASTELSELQGTSQGSRSQNHQQRFASLECMAIRHARWKRLMGSNHSAATRRRYWMMDVLCAIANQETDYLSMLGRRSNTATKPWERFLAASAVFQFHCHEVTRNMSEVLDRAARLMSAYLQPHPTLMSAPYSFSSLYEEMAIILAHSMSPVPEVLQRSASLSHLRTTVQQQLSTMTHRVLQFMQYYCKTSSRSPQHSHFGCPCQDPRVILYTIQYVMTKQYKLVCQPLTRSSFHQMNENPAHDVEQSFEACSISKVLTAASSSQPRPGTASTRAPQPSNPCHPALFAIIFQGIARRMGIKSDIVTCCSRNCRVMLRVPVPSIATPPQSPPRSPQRHQNQLYSSPKPPPLRPNWFVDLHEGPVNILTTTTQCLDWLEDHCHEQQYPSTPSLPNLHSPPRNVTIVPDDDESVEGRQHYDPRQLRRLQDRQCHHPLFWSQSPMKVSTMLPWLAAPIVRHSVYYEEDDIGKLQLPPEPHQILLQHLLRRSDEGDDVEGDNDDDDELLGVLQDRILLFPSLLSYCQVIDVPSES